MLDGLVLMMQKVSKFPKFQTIFRKLINNIPVKKIYENTHRIHKKTCGILFYLKWILLIPYYILITIKYISYIVWGLQKLALLNKILHYFHWKLHFSSLLTIECKSCKNRLG